MKNTKLEYMYRDSANYKDYGSVVVKGELTAGEVSSLLDAFGTGNEGFVPYRVGIDSLSPVLDNTEEAMQEAIANAEDEEQASNIERFDHCYHELLDVESTDEEPTIDISAQDLYKKMIESRS